MSELQTDGERVIADTYQDSDQGIVIYSMHMATYNYAIPYCLNKDVIDLGCGSGYGASYIAPHTKSITAVDISSDAIDYAKTRYQHSQLSFQVIKANTRLPFDDNSFDTALSFQVIEHVDNDVGYLQEAFRILKPNGVLLLVTPDRKKRLFPLQSPWNRWHLREYSEKSLARVASQVFKSCSSASMVAPKDIEHFENKRCAKLKWLTLPFTLPVISSKLRFRLLTYLGKFSQPGTQAPVTIKSSYHDITFSKDSSSNLNLLMVCKK